MQLDGSTAVFGKPVVEGTHASVPNRGGCPESRAALVDVLRWERDAVPVENDAWVYLANRYHLQPPSGTPLIGWKRFRLNIKAENNWPGIDGSRPLGSEEPSLVARAIIDETRPVRVALPHDAGPDGVTSEGNYFIRINARRLKRGGGEGVAAIVGLPGDCRLVYGEIRQAKYTPLWDSRLFPANPGLRYKDLDGDGVDEILVQGRSWIDPGARDGWSFST
jgi:hypothetical protein